MNSFFSVLSLCMLLFTVACKSNVKEAESQKLDLPAIKERGVLKVVTDYNSTNYFVYKGRPLGYQYELLQALSKYLDIKLEISVSNDTHLNIDRLLNGDIDLIATNLSSTTPKKDKIAYTEPHCATRQVLVQQKFNNTPTRSDRVFNKVIRNQIGLAGKTIYVQKNSKFIHQLEHVSEQIGDSIKIVEIADYEVEQLIGLVAEGEIPYTICDENMAQVNLNFYDNIDVGTAVSYAQNMAWAVRPKSRKLLAEVNRWMVDFKKTDDYKRIYNKYFVVKRTTHILDAGYSAVRGGKVSEYDAIIKHESLVYAMDWRLIASLIYQESRFLPEAESWAGAKGLMQLMPETALQFGVTDISSPVDNIRGGLKFLDWLTTVFTPKIKNPDERIKFILASYNVGVGHVFDAMRLAEKNGKNPSVWDDNVDFYLLNKSDPAYYSDPVVKHGYCRGEEPYMYVIDILERYNHYKKVLAN